jgi:hypothetical protein
MASKLRTVLDTDTGARIGVVFFCPGCGQGHYVTVNGHRNACGATWQWNGSEESPTFTPSILSNPDYPAGRCHCFVRDGQIQFLNDCFHELAGQTVALPDKEGIV